MTEQKIQWEEWKDRPVPTRPLYNTTEMIETPFYFFEDDDVPFMEHKDNLEEFAYEYQTVLEKEGSVYDYINWRDLEQFLGERLDHEDFLKYEWLMREADREEGMDPQSPGFTPSIRKGERVYYHPPYPRKEAASVHDAALVTILGISDRDEGERLYFRAQAEDGTEFTAPYEDFVPRAAAHEKKLREAAMIVKCCFDEFGRAWEHLRSIAGVITDERAMAESYEEKLDRNDGYFFVSGGLTTDPGKREEIFQKLKGIDGTLGLENFVEEVADIVYERKEGTV